MTTDTLLKDLAGCGSAETLIATILKHYPDLSAPVAVEDIARQIGIMEFRGVEEESIACGLIEGGQPGQGVILHSNALTPQRRRFAAAHQLGHFLMRTYPGDRHCTALDLSENRRDTLHRKEEAQANRFAAGLLMPKPLMSAALNSLGKPTIAHIAALATSFGVTVEAAASRYTDVTALTCAILFVKNGVVLYARPSRSFPSLSIKRGDPAPVVVQSDKVDQPSPWLAVEARDWLALSRDLRAPKLSMQVLAKKNGLHLVMLVINAAAERRADEEAEKYATERPKFGRGADRR